MATNPLDPYLISANLWDSKYWLYNSGNISPWASSIFSDNGNSFGRRFFVKDRVSLLNTTYYYKYQQTTNPSLLNTIPTIIGRESPYNNIPIVGGFFPYDIPYGAAYIWNLSGNSYFQYPWRPYSNWTLSCWLNKPDQGPNARYREKGQGGSSKLLTIYVGSNTTPVPLFQINNVSGLNTNVTFTYYPDNSFTGRTYVDSWNGTILAEQLYKNVVVSLDKTNNASTWTLSVFVNAVQVYQKTLNASNNGIFYPAPLQSLIRSVEFGTDSNGLIPNEGQNFNFTNNLYGVDELAVYRTSVNKVNWLSWASQSGNFNVPLKILRAEQLVGNVFSGVSGTAQAKRFSRLYSFKGTGTISTIASSSASANYNTPPWPPNNHRYPLSSTIYGQNFSEYFQDVSGNLPLEYVYRKYFNSSRLSALTSGVEFPQNAGVFGVRSNNSTPSPNNWQWNSASTNVVSAGFFQTNKSWAISFWIKQLETSTLIPYSSPGKYYDDIINCPNLFSLSAPTPQDLVLNKYTYTLLYFKYQGLAYGTPENAFFNGVPNSYGTYQFNISRDFYKFIVIGWDLATRNLYIIIDNNFIVIDNYNSSYQLSSLNLGYRALVTPSFTTNFGPPAVAIQDLVFYNNGLNVSANPFNSPFSVTKNNVTTLYNTFPPLQAIQAYNKTVSIPFKYVFTHISQNFQGNLLTGISSPSFIPNGISGLPNDPNSLVGKSPIAKYSFSNFTTSSNPNGYVQYNFKDLISNKYTNQNTNPLYVKLGGVGRITGDETLTNWADTFWRFGSLAYTANSSNYPVLTTGKINEKAVVVGETLYVFDNLSIQGLREYETKFKSSFTFDLSQTEFDGFSWTYSFWFKFVDEDYGGKSKQSNAQYFNSNNNYFKNTTNINYVSRSSFCSLRLGKTYISGNPVIAVDAPQISIHVSPYLEKNLQLCYNPVAPNFQIPYYNILQLPDKYVGIEIGGGFVFNWSSFAWDQNGCPPQKPPKFEYIQEPEGLTGVLDGNWHHMTIVFGSSNIAWKQNVLTDGNLSFNYVQVPIEFYLDGFFESSVYCNLQGSSSDIGQVSSVSHGIAKDQYTALGKNPTNTALDEAIDLTTQRWKTNNNETWSKQIAPFSIPYAIDQPQFFNTAFSANQVLLLYKNIAGTMIVLQGGGVFGHSGTANAYYIRNARIGSGTIQVTADAKVIVNFRKYISSGTLSVIANAKARLPYLLPMHKYSFNLSTQVGEYEFLDLVGNKNFVITDKLFINDNANLLTTGRTGDALYLGSKYKPKINTNAWYAAGRVTGIDWGGVNQFTISFWLKLDLLPNNSAQGFWFRMFNASNPSNSISIKVGNFSKFSTIPDASSNTFNIVQPFNTNTFTHFLITYNQTSQLVAPGQTRYGTYLIYIDGFPPQSNYPNNIFNFVPYVSPLCDTIEFGGGENDLLKPQDLIPRRFILDDLQIFNRSLTQTEILNLYYNRFGPLPASGRFELSGSASYFTGGRAKGNGGFELTGQNSILIGKALVFSNVGIIVNGAEAISFINTHNASGSGTIQVTASAECGINKWIFEANGSYQVVANANAFIKQYRYKASGQFELIGSFAAGRGSLAEYPIHKYLFTNIIFYRDNGFNVEFIVNDLAGTDDADFKWTQDYIYEEYPTLKSLNPFALATNLTDLASVNQATYRRSIASLTPGKFSKFTIQVGSLTQEFTSLYQNQYNTKYVNYYYGVFSINKTFDNLIKNSQSFTISYWYKKEDLPKPQFPPFPSVVKQGEVWSHQFVQIGNKSTFGTLTSVNANPYIFANAENGYSAKGNEIPPQEWTHLCYVCNNTLVESDGFVYVYQYKNGVFVQKIKKDTINQGNLNIPFLNRGGSGPFFSIGVSGQNLAGNIISQTGNTLNTLAPIYDKFGPAAFAVDDIRIYNKALSLLQINHIYNSINFYLAKGSIQVVAKVSVVFMPNRFIGSGTFQITGEAGVIKSVWYYTGQGVAQVTASNKFRLPYEYPIHQYIFDDDYGFEKDSAGSCDLQLSIFGSAITGSYKKPGLTGKSLGIGTTGYYSQTGLFEYLVSAELNGNTKNNFLQTNTQFTLSFWLSPAEIDHGSYNADEYIIKHFGNAPCLFIQHIEGIGIQINFYYLRNINNQFIQDYRSFTINLSTISLLTFTYNSEVSYGNQQSGEWKLYINDGSTQEYVIRTNFSASSFINPTGSFAKTIFGQGENSPSILRTIDDIRYYDRVLYQNEVANLYNFIFGPVVGDPDFQMTGSAPVAIRYVYGVIGSGTFELIGNAEAFQNAYQYNAAGSFQTFVEGFAYKNYYDYISGGSIQIEADSIAYLDYYVDIGSGQFENSGTALCFQDSFQYNADGLLQVEANALYSIELSQIGAGQFENIGEADNYVIYNYGTTQGQFELSSSAVVQLKYFASGSGVYQVVADAEATPIIGNLWFRTSHLYQLKSNMFDGRGDFQIIFNGLFGTSTSMPNYGYSIGTYPFVGNGDEQDAFFSGERFAITFRFLITDIAYDKELIKLNSNDAMPSIIPPSIEIVYQSNDQSIRYGFNGDTLSATTIQANQWYFVTVVKRGEKLYSSLNAGTRLIKTYDYNTINFYGIESQNALTTGDQSGLYYADIRFYKDMITSAETTYLYNNGIPTGISPINVAENYNNPSHEYNFDFSDRVSECCYELVDSAGDDTIILDTPITSLQPYLDGLDGNAIRLGNNYLNQGGLYSYSAYGYSYNNFIGSGSYSIAFWHKLLGPSIGSVDPETNLPFADTFAVTTSTGEVIFSIKESNGILTFSLENTFFEPVEYEISTGNDLQSWNHIAITVNTDQGRAYIYFNSDLIMAFPYTRILTNPAALFLGFNSYLNTFSMKAMSIITQSYCELQALDELLFFAAPATAWDILTLYNCGENANIEKTLDLPFNAGNLPVYQYRFEANCNGYDANNKLVPSQTLGQDCNYTQFVNSGAESLTSACQKLLDAGYDFEVTSIQRWSNPTTFQTGTFQDGVYENITDYCSDPACFNFCINYRANVQISAIMIAITDEDEITASGGFQISGVAGLVFNQFSATGTGSIQLSGISPASQIGGVSGLTCTGSGSPQLFGSAIYDSSDKGILNSDVSCDIQLINLQPFVVATSGNPLIGSQGLSTINTCGCISLPFEIQILHNLNSQDSELLRFIKRNNFILPNRVVMILQGNRRYAGHLRYSGLSARTNDLEVWNVSFELGCTDFLNSFNGVYDWNLTITIRRTPTLVVSTDTKIVVLLKSNYVCPKNGISFSFRADSNLITKLLTVNSNTFLTNSVIVNDRIYLFASEGWIENPVLTLQIGLPQ